MTNYWIIGFINWSTLTSEHSFLTVGEWGSIFWLFLLLSYRISFPAFSPWRLWSKAEVKLLKCAESSACQFLCIWVLQDFSCLQKRIPHGNVLNENLVYSVCCCCGCCCCCCFTKSWKLSLKTKCTSRVSPSFTQVFLLLWLSIVCTGKVQTQLQEQHCNTDILKGLKDKIKK